MTAAVLDTLRCAQTLKDAGFAPKQAEATAQVLGDALADVATKEDLDRHTAMQKADLGRHTAMQKAALDRHTAMQKAALDRLEAKQRADLDRLEAKLDDAVAGLNTKIDNARSAGKSDLQATADRLDSKIDTVEQNLGEKIEGKFNTLNRNIIVLNGLVFVMLAAILAFGFNAMTPPSAWSGEPQASVRSPADSPATQARPAPSEPLPEPQPSKPPASSPAQDTSNAPHAHPADAGKMPPPKPLGAEA